VHNRLLHGFAGRFNRNHRKLLLVDGSLAILGINIGDAFADWADLAVELRGEVCRALARRLHGEHFVAQNGHVRVHLSRIGGGRRLRRMYLKAFARAQRRITLAHSYFLPDARLVRGLAHAARRGVDVLLLLPGKSDVPLVRVATAAHYRRLLRSGVRVLEWDRGILHAKAAVVDGQELLLGSFNLDPFSLANLETLLVAENAALAARAEAWILRHAAEAHPAAEPSGTSWLAWLMQKIARLLGRLMRRL
jgi:cardiolipin synthase